MIDDYLPESPIGVCLRLLEAIRIGDLELFEIVSHPDAYNHESVIEPVVCRGRGPRAYHATSVLLRNTFADLNWDVEHALHDNDMVVIRARMSGRHVGPLYSYNSEGLVTVAFPGTRRKFSVTQTHLFRIADGLVIEHWANRDDVGLMEQLGILPPSPKYLGRMLASRLRAKRQERHGVVPGLAGFAMNPTEGEGMAP